MTVEIAFRKKSNDIIVQRGKERVEEGTQTNKFDKGDSDEGEQEEKDQSRPLHRIIQVFIGKLYFPMSFLWKASCLASSFSTEQVELASDIDSLNRTVTIQFQIDLILSHMFKHLVLYQILSMLLILRLEASL